MTSPETPRAQDQTSSRPRLLLMANHAVITLLRLMNLMTVSLANTRVDRRASLARPVEIRPNRERISRHRRARVSQRLRPRCSPSQEE